MERGDGGAVETVGLKTVGEPLKLTSGKWYYEVTIGDPTSECSTIWLV